MRKFFGLACVALLALASVVRAEAINVAQIADDAKWAVHLDIDALRSTTLAIKIVDAVREKHPEADDHLAMIRSVANFDPTTDLHGITIYGRSIKPGAGVAIVHATVDKKLLLEKVELAPEHRVSKYGKYDLHSWIHAKGTKHERSMTGTFYKDDVMLFAISSEEVMAAIDVLDGKKPSFAGKERQVWLGSNIPSGAILIAGAVGLDTVKLPCESPFVKQLKSLVLIFGEDAGNLYVQGNLMVKEVEVAQQLKAVADGAIAMALLSKKDDPNAVKLIKTVKVSQSDKTVIIDAKASVDDVWAQMKKAAKKFEEQKCKGLPNWCKPPYKN